MAKKLAAIHCVGRGMNTMSVQDMNFGIRLAKILSDALIDAVNGNQGETAIERATSRIKAILLKFPDGAQVRDISLRSKITTKVQNQAIFDLWYQGAIICADKKGTPIDLEGITKLPRGAIYKLNGTC